MMTIRPGSTTVEAGTATCASTLATATAVPGLQTCPLRGLGGQTAGLAAERRDVARQLLVHDVLQPRIERGEVGVAWEALAFRPEALVAGRTRVARLVARQLPDHPVGGLDQPIGGLVDLRRLVQDLQRLGEEPLRRDLAAVAIEPRFAHLARGGVDLVRFGLRGVMLPQLDPRVGIVSPFRQEAERRAVRLDRQHRAGGEVDAQADHVVGRDAALLEHRRHGVMEYFQVVVRVLQRPIGRQPQAGTGQPLVDHAVGIGMNRGRHLATIGHIHQQRPPRFGAEVNADCVFGTHVGSPYT